MENAISAARRNWLLAALSPEDLSLLAPHLKVIPMELGGLLQQEGELIEAVYFPLDGMVSLLAIMADGDGIETVTVGREGAVGAGAGFGNRNAFTRAIVQAPGSASRIGISQFQRAVSQSETIRGVVVDNLELTLAQAQQTTACNAAHNLEERLARWLLQTRDRVSGNTLPLTQDFLSQMLAVRRTSVTLAAQALQRTGAIRYVRGRIEVVDRHKLEGRACGCYEIIRRQGEGALARTGGQ